MMPAQYPTGRCASNPRRVTRARPARCSASHGRRAVAFLLLLALLAPALAGCAGIPVPRAIVPESLILAAQPVHVGDVRIWGDEPMPAMAELGQHEVDALKAKLQIKAKAGVRVQSSILALSGGADDGAFGAGLLVGWSERGDRPEFALVTGISAGALIAPFAFLGPAYDPQLTKVFTSYGSEQIYEANILGGLLGKSAFADNEPLKRLIARYVDAAMLARLAEERSKGRILLIGTTNIDAQRPVFWDVGRIAQIGGPKALELLRTVLLASAAIPGVFPPVRIEVEAGGKVYEELHVDGGTTREVFLSPADFSFREMDRLLGLKVDRRLYVILNGKIGAEWQATEESALALGSRSLSTVLKSQAIGDLIRIHAKTRADGIAFNLAVIPDDFKAPRPKPFDQAYMQALFAVGRKAGQEGYPWLKAPPGISPSQ